MKKQFSDWTKKKNHNCVKHFENWSCDGAKWVVLGLGNCNLQALHFSTSLVFSDQQSFDFSKLASYLILDLQAFFTVYTFFFYFLSFLSLECTHLVLCTQWKHKWWRILVIISSLYFWHRIYQLNIRPDSKSTHGQCLFSFLQWPKFCDTTLDSVTWLQFRYVNIWKAELWR